MRNILKITVVAGAVLTLSACGITNNSNEIEPYEGKVSIIGKDHIVNDDRSFIDDIKKTPEEEWLTDLYLADKSKSVTISIDEASFNNLKLGQTFCYSNLGEKDVLEQVDPEDDCDFNTD